MQELTRAGVAAVLVVAAMAVIVAPAQAITGDDPCFGRPGVHEAGLICGRDDCVDYPNASTGAGYAWLSGDDGGLNCPRNSYILDTDY